jgi:4-hydroxybenzoate polyprenyltransferase
MNQVKKIIEYLEDERRPFHYYLLTFLSAVVLRSLLEFMLGGSYSAGIEPGMPLHYGLFYSNFALAVVLIVHLFSGERLERVSRAVMAGFIIVVTPPLADLLLQLAWKYQIVYLYMQPEHMHGLFRKYLLLGGDFIGAPPGVRIEVVMAMVGCGIYVYYKKTSVLRAVLVALTFYSVLFWIYFTILFPSKWLCDIAGLEYETSNTMFVDVYLFLFLPLMLCVAYLYRPGYCKAIARDIRLTRILHYMLMALFGLIVGNPVIGGSFLKLTDILRFVFLTASLVFACIFSTVTNNISDINIDRISNPGRPSVTGEIPPQAYKAIGFAALLLSLAYSLAAGYLTMFLVVCAIGCYFLYSMPPFRLKRIPFFSKGIIAFNSLIMVLAGYNFAGKNINQFPSGIAALVIVFLTLCTNFIDIKDYEGDLAGGIRTLPVIFGLKKGKIIIGSLFLLCYALFPYFVGMPELFLPSLVTGILLFYAVTRKRYRENLVFLLYLLSGTVFWVYLVINR